MEVLQTVVLPNLHYLAGTLPALIRVLPMLSPCQVAGWLPWCPRPGGKGRIRIPKR